MFWRCGKANSGSSDDDDIPRVAGDERIYAVGDLHGRLDLLEALLARIDQDVPTRPSGRRLRLIFLGDYIDRGNQSREVIEFLIDLRQRCGDCVEFLSGNHEAALLGFLDDPLNRRDWLKWGGRQTLTSYGVISSSDNLENADLVAVRNALAHAMGDHADFLRGLGRCATSGSVVFAHAALDPAYKLRRQPDAALLWGRIVGGGVGGLRGYRLVHGHFATVSPVSTPSHINIDTGAYYSGTLTAVRLDEEEAFLNGVVRSTDA